MLKQVHYGKHTFKPWYRGVGYVDTDAKSLKSFRSREPRPIWQDLAKPDDLKEYDLHICQHCFVYTASGDQLSKHELVCPYKQKRLGKLVFEDNKFEIYEVRPDKAHRFPLQCLSLFGHLFLETKSICFNLDAFVFYLAYSKQEQMYAGFFSKETNSWHDYNLACIVVFPPFQKLGLGQSLIDFSYTLSAFDKILGSPEKPLSAHGQAAYERYWKQVFSEYLVYSKRQLKDRKTRRPGTGNGFTSLKDISKYTAVSEEDLAGIADHALTTVSNRKKFCLKKLLGKVNK